jgi:hypothetical protein
MAEISSNYPPIEVFVLTNTLLEQTVRSLRADKGDDVENIAFWAGHVASGRAEITHLLVPRGKGVIRAPYFIQVESNTISALCELLDPPRVVILAQIHTHLGRAFHSETDDKFSFDTPGYLSVVIPRCGRGGYSLWHDWSYNICLGNGKFRELSRAEIINSFIIETETTIITQEISE